jgi:hypothetical protein
MMVPPSRCCGPIARAGQISLAPAPGDLDAFVERGIPQSQCILVEAVDDADELEAVFVLLGRKLDSVVGDRQLLADRRDAGEPALLALEKLIELLPKQVGPDIGKAARIGRLLRRARVPERAAERALAPGLRLTRAPRWLRRARMRAARSGPWSPSQSPARRCCSRLFVIFRRS